MKLAGLPLPGLLQRYHGELFEGFLPWWNQHGIDHEHGGFFHRLDYDGTLLDPEKFGWFQGRGIWIFSFLYNYFGKDPRHLEVARKTKDFLLRAAPQADGWWAESLSREGKALIPFRGDVYGMYFAAEGLQEYAWAAKDDQSRDLAFGLIKKLLAAIDRPDFRLMGTGEPGQRVQGLWMVNLRLATQILRRWNDAAIAAIADRSLEAILQKHYNPEIGLNTETLNHDFSRPPDEAAKSLLGHSVETLWMVLDEAARRKDQGLYNTAVERIRRHLDVGWDRVYGGLVQWVNVDHGGYEWPVEKPVGTNLEFRGTGEYFYLKPLWALNEVLVASLEVYERTGAPWAAEYFDKAQAVIDAKYSLWARERRYGHMLFADRKMTWQPHVSRQDNYHPPRQLMLNLLGLGRMTRSGAAPRP